MPPLHPLSLVHYLLSQGPTRQAKGPQPSVLHTIPRRRSSPFVPFFPSLQHPSSPFPILPFPHPSLRGDSPSCVLLSAVKRIQGVQCLSRGISSVGGGQPFPSQGGVAGEGFGLWPKTSDGAFAPIVHFSFSFGLWPKTLAGAFALIGHFSFRFGLGFHNSAVA